MEGPHQEQAKRIYTELRTNIIDNVFKEYERTGYVWEQYNAKTGEGRRSHPFTGWTSLVTLSKHKSTSAAWYDAEVLPKLFQKSINTYFCTTYDDRDLKATPAAWCTRVCSQPMKLDLRGRQDGRVV